MKKLFIPCLIFLLVYFGGVFQGLEASGPVAINAKILPSIWLSKLTVTEGDNLIIYAAIQNNSGLDFVGTASFTVDDLEQPSQTFNSHSGQLLEISSSWLAVTGDHQISASIKTSLSSNQTLISYQTEIIDLKVKAKIIPRVTVPGSLASYIGMVDEVVTPVISDIESWKKAIPESQPTATSQARPKVAKSQILDQNLPASAANFLPKASAVLGASTEAVTNLGDHWSDRLYNLAVSLLALTVKHWLWSLPLLLFLIWRIWSKF